MQMNFKKIAAEAAIRFIEGNTIIGLGDGAAISYMVKALTVNKNNSLTLFTSSFSTKKLLEDAGFTVNEISAVSALDIYFDGCDQFDKNLNALKSGSGIHTTEKLLASMAGQFILVGDESKYVDALQTKYPVVIEVIPDAIQFAQEQVHKIFPFCKTQVRESKTRYSNLLIDIWFDEFPGLPILNSALKNITGVLESSLFYNMAHKAVIAGENGLRVIEKQEYSS
jgi:ribose 5-phosphate isomerase A